MGEKNPLGVNMSGLPMLTEGGALRPCADSRHTHTPRSWSSAVICRWGHISTLCRLICMGAVTTHDRVAVWCSIITGNFECDQLASGASPRSRPRENGAKISVRPSAWAVKSRCLNSSPLHQTDTAKQRTDTNGHVSCYSHGGNHRAVRGFFEVACKLSNALRHVRTSPWPSTDSTQLPATSDTNGVLISVYFESDLMWYFLMFRRHETALWAQHEQVSHGLTMCNRM